MGREAYKEGEKEKSNKGTTITESQHILGIQSEGMGYNTHIFVDGKELKNVIKAEIHIKAGEPVYGKVWIFLPELDFKEEVYEFRKSKSVKSVVERF